MSQGHNNLSDQNIFGQESSKENLFNDDGYEDRLEKQNQNAHKVMDQMENILQQNIITLDQLLEQLQTDFNDSGKIELKVKSMKILHEKIQESQFNKSLAITLSEWLQSNRIVEKFLNVNTHPQILNKLPRILKFLYDNKQLQVGEIIQIIKISLKAQEQFVKVAEAIIKFLNLPELENVFELACEEKDLNSQNLITVISTLSSTLASLSIKDNSQKKKNSRQTNNILSGLHESGREHMEEWLHEESHQQTQMDIENVEGVHEKHLKIISLVQKLFKFLINCIKSQEHAQQQSYVNMINKIISSKYSVLQPQLQKQLITLFKQNNTYSLWILETSLKMDKDHEGKKKKHHNSYFINKMVGEGLYEYVFAILARNRFTKGVVEKALNIIILLCRYCKPLQRFYIAHLWKILGLVSRDQKQREQFFIFVKEALRFEESFAEESVNFIYFDILMKLHPAWFSQRVYECIELLFMRLNEDLKLISYENQKYQIIDPDLVGLDKFWYIYFYSPQQKVAKKCKQFLWRLASYENSEQIKKKIYEKYIDKILRIMQDSKTDEIEEIHLRGFDIIEKMITGITKKSEYSSQLIEIIAENSTTDSFQQAKIFLKLPETTPLYILKEHIGNEMNPKKIKLDLLFRGNFLKGEQMNLKSLKFSKGVPNRLTIVDKPQENHEEKNKALKQIQNSLVEVLGAEYEHGFLKYVSEKMQGQTSEFIIMEMVQNQGLVEEMKLEYSEKQKEEKGNEEVDSREVEIPSSEKENIPDDFHFDKTQNLVQERQKQNKMQEEEEERPKVKFSDMLVKEQSNIHVLLHCSQLGDYFKGWETIKKLPIDVRVINQIKEKAHNQEWDLIFIQESYNDMENIYKLHLLKHIVKKQKNLQLLQKKGGYHYLVNWLRNIFHSKNYLLLEEVLELINLVFKEKCKLIDHFESNLNKPELSRPTNLLNLLIEQLYTQNLMIPFEDEIESDFSHEILELLLDVQKNTSSGKYNFPAANFHKILLYYILKHPKGYILCLNLSDDDLNRLLRLQGWKGEYILMISLAICKNENFEPQEKAKSLLNKLMKNMYIVDEQGSSAHKNKLSFYQTISNILSCGYEPNSSLIEIVKNLIKIIRQNSTLMAIDQFVGMLQVLEICLDGIYAVLQESEQFDIMISQFAQWLFQVYLFCLDNPHVYIKDKNIRKYAYDVLLVLCRNNKHLEKNIIKQIMAIKIKKRDPDESYIDFRKDEHVGLRNLAATCYINSVLQQIYHTKFSQLYLQKNINNEEEGFIDVEELKKIFMRLFSSNKNVVNPSRFIHNTTLFGMQIVPTIQQDSCEFLMSIMNTLQAAGFKEEIDKVFGGETCDQIVVDYDGIQPKYRKQSFYSIILPIKGKKNLQDALADYIQTQNLEGQNKFECEELKKKVNAKKRTFFLEMPNIFIINLKRFEYDIEIQNRKKLNDYLEFPLELDMEKYSAEYNLKGKTDKFKFNEQTNYQYQLVGIVVHSGTAEGGHYYSLIKLGESWFTFDDSRVSEFKISNLRNECFGGSSENRKNAYFLFYEKINSNHHGIFLKNLQPSLPIKRLIQTENAEFLKSRLAYDQNFITFLQNLQKNTQNTSLQQLLELMKGKKKDFQLFDIKEIEQEKRDNGAIVYFDEEKQGLLKADNNDDNDQNDTLGLFK